jgi:hypothetical protein
VKALTRRRLAAGGAVAALAAPPTAYACACCANRGDHSAQTARIARFELNELIRLRFGTTTHLRTTPGFPADIKGIKPIATRYRLSQARHGRIFVFTFRDARANKGTLGFELPQRATRLAVDPQDGRRSPGGGPLLYKEWRLQGRITTSGIFAGAGSPRFRLVLQGRGNACVNASDFRSWILQATGRKAAFTLYGAFGRPAA